MCSYETDDERQAAMKVEFGGWPAGSHQVKGDDVVAEDLVLLGSFYVLTGLSDQMSGRPRGASEAVLLEAAPDDSRRQERSAVSYCGRG